MDIKSKNKIKIRSITAVLILTLFTVGTIASFPWFNRMAQEYLKEYDMNVYTENALQDWVLQIYQGCYILYYEKEKESTGKNADQIFLESYQMRDDEAESEWSFSEILENELEQMDESFAVIRTVFDYCILEDGGVYRKNTSRPLEDALSGKSNEILQEYYTDYFLIDFGENGSVTVQSLYAGKINTDFLIKLFDNVSRKNLLMEKLSDQYLLNGNYIWKQPVDFQVVIGIPDTEEAKNYLSWEVGYRGGEYTYWQLHNAYISVGAVFFYLTMLVLVTVSALFMTSKNVWKAEISMNRPRGCYLFEASVIGGCIILSCAEGFMEMMWGVEEFQSYGRMYHALFEKGMIDMVIVAVTIFTLYAGWYLCVRFLRPVFTLGPWEYVRQYSLIYQIFPWIHGYWKRFKEEIQHIDFGQSANRTILKIVLLNLIVASLCACMWMFGIFPLIAYSVILLFLCRRYYDKAGNDYRNLLEGMQRLAEGDLAVEIQENLGHFEPLKKELYAIRYGLKKAVEKEVKSERMKTELITNVSHDLKTPLTAITTYVELLKKEDITAEERDSYIEILENKALRLKVLIEDLFEVSKAASRNIILNLVEVDVVNLLKQVSVEYAAQLEKADLMLRWELPEEKLILRLDSTKTYRIFENLFINICKYAMNGSRVYILAAREAAGIVMSIKNISADEIRVSPDELTERFVRGDASRNTEGSGLGLAIAKSFTEAQNGVFQVEIDGDLFKVTIRFPDTL